MGEKGKGDGNATQRHTPGARALGRSGVDYRLALGEGWGLAQEEVPTGHGAPM